MYSLRPLIMSNFKKQCVDALLQNQNDILQNLLSENRRNTQIEVILNGLEFLTLAINNNNLQAVRLLLAFEADEELTQKAFEELCALAVDKDAKIMGLLHASRVLQDIELDPRRKLRSKFIFSYRGEYDWFYALYGEGLIQSSFRLVESNADRMVILRFLNRLAKIDSSKDDNYTFNDKPTLLIIDYVTSNRVKYVNPGNLSIATIFEQHFQDSNKSCAVPMIWEEYQQFAEIRSFDESINDKTMLEEIMQNEDFCFLHLNYQRTFDFDKFDFANNRVIKEHSFEKMLTDPKLLGKKLYDCCSFMIFAENYPDSLPVIMPIIISDRDLFSKIFLGIGAENKQPIKATLKDFPEYIEWVNEEALFWKPIMDDNVNVLENLNSIMKQAILSNSERILNRIVQEINYIVSAFKVNKTLLITLEEALKSVIETRNKIFEGTEPPFDQLPDADLTLQLLDKFIKDVKRIENKIKIPSLQLLALHTLWKNNKIDEIKDIKSLEELRTTEENKSEFRLN